MLASREREIRHQLGGEPAVEDDADEREMLASLLRRRGCDVATAADGLEALHYLRKNEQPDDDT